MPNSIPPTGSINPAIRFEVFKRDKFTCQYCGKKTPQVVLTVGYIKPPEAGGSHELSNLITTCSDCPPIRKPDLEEDKKEQIESLIESNKSLVTFNEEMVDMLVEYINSKIPPSTLNENGRAEIKKLYLKFTPEQIIQGVDVAETTYLKYENSLPTEESVEVFLSKLGGVIAIKNMPVLKQKAAYVKGIARNRFGYWDDRKGSIILNNYISALRNYGWADSQITDDLEKEIIPFTKEAKNWTEWRTQLENWTADINNWEKTNFPSKAKKTDMTLEEIRGILDINLRNIRYKIEALLYLGESFPDFKPDEFKKDILKLMKGFMSQLKDIYVSTSGYPEKNPEYVGGYLFKSGIFSHFDTPESLTEGKLSTGVLTVIEDSCIRILTDLFEEFYLPDSFYNRTAIDIFIKDYIEAFSVNEEEFFPD